MRKTLVNQETIEGRVYDHNLSIRVTGENSKNPGTEYIRGSLDIVTDDEGLNVLTVDFTYVTETTSKGGKNASFAALKNIIDSNKTVLSVGMENAMMVSVNTSLGLNDFYTNRNGAEELVSAKRNDGGFVTIVNKLNSPEDRNTFTCDMLINGVRTIEADPEKNIPKDYMIIKGAVFNFRKAILPVEFVVRSEGGMKYFNSLDISSSNMVFTKVWGTINCKTIITRKEEETAFGGPCVKEYERKSREWEITRAAKEPYEMGDEENGITLDEIKQMLADREVHLAEVKKNADDWKATKQTTATANVAAAPAAVGGFNF